MFEHDTEIVSELLSADKSFQRLYNKHTELKEKVHDAEIGVLPLDDDSLGEMKKEKLLTKDKLSSMIEEYRRQHL